MRILKHGTLQSRKFVCKVCGCEFVADACEYSVETMSGFVIGYGADCPCCDHYTGCSELWEEEDG